MSAREFELFLARIYVDASARARFEANPRDAALRAGLSEEECAALENVDPADLELAARSYARKRLLTPTRNRMRSFCLRLREFLSSLR